MNIPQTAREALKIQFAYSAGFAQANLDGIDHAASLRAPDSGGNCINWVLGHLVQARNAALQMLGQPPVIEAEAVRRYARGSAPLLDPADATDFSALVGAFHAAQTALTRGLDDVNETTWATPAPFSPTNDPDETIGSLLVGLAFHETYHVGQLGVLRRAIGLEGAIE